MSEKTSYEPGTPCWIDLGTPDQDAAAGFYAALFGWDVEEDENAEQTGGYRVATLNGKAVGGVMKLMQDGQPPAWMTYVSVEDADATAAAARGAGGEAVVEPMTVLDYGRMAILKDPTGAVVGIWQPGTNIGAQVVNETGAFCWSEISTRDPEAAKAFYGDVFGWAFDDREFEGAGTYTIVSNGDNGFAGLTDMRGRVPDEVPANWLVYFAVEDAEATVERAKRGGGSVAMGPTEIGEVGTIAVLRDPFGASFAVIQPNPQMSSGG
jgi:predicted enzyme related to lactoylglutathione lyase